MFVTNELCCTLVSFFSSSDYRAASHLFSLYVNDSTGNVGLSVQECSQHMDFLANSMWYPFLDRCECMRQIDFCNKIYKRWFPTHEWKPQSPDESVLTNKNIRTDVELTVDAGDL